MTLPEVQRHRRIMRARRQGLLGSKQHHEVFNNSPGRDPIEEYPNYFKIDEELL